MNWTLRPATSPIPSLTFTQSLSDAPPSARGKFLYVGAQKFFIRGVTYGPFHPNDDGSEYHSPALVARDFAQMTANGVNTVRTYTVPPRWFLDLAQLNNLRVFIGLPWEQHLAFLDDPPRARAIEQSIRAGIRASLNHPAVLGYTIGNEIPASIVRWYGASRVERFIERLYHAAKIENPNALVTYVNYPSTEYLQLPFLDLVCFNVYLESRDRLAAYLARLQNLAGNKPLILAEVGLDSRRKGLTTQARTLQWQIETAFASGATGTFLFAWTDEWYRGGYDILDWDFGLTDRARRGKPALSAVREAFAHVPFVPNPNLPRISVVVCSHNGARTIRDCCEGLLELDYPNYEVIVVDDGSCDATGSIADEYGFRVIRTENGGLSRARNLGMCAASGEIIAYLDDDARPDAHWLRYLAHTFMSTRHAAVGGPNIAPRGDGLIAECVAGAPGNPVHVLLSNQQAEHIPGCNLAIRKECLEAIGGFDPQFRIAGDDVDVCWRLQERGWTLGFNPAALVWHHRRNSIRAYWAQQIGYGRAEALLENKWPEKYNAMGHFTWAGRVYGNGHASPIGNPRERIFYGTWGSALFQSIYESAPHDFWWLPLMPEWYLVIFILAALSASGLWWMPMLIFTLPLALAVGLLLAQATLSAAKADLIYAPRSRWVRIQRRGIILLLHLLQPLARLWGRRWRIGIRTNGKRASHSFHFSLPRTQTFAIWSEQWNAAEEWLRAVERAVKTQRGIVRRGGEFDRWDLQVRGGMFARAQVLMAIEEHGAGKQMLRFRISPRCSPAILALNVVLATFAVTAMLNGRTGWFALLATLVVIVTACALREWGHAVELVTRALHQTQESFYRL